MKSPGSAYAGEDKSRPAVIKPVRKRFANDSMEGPHFIAETVSFHVCKPNSDSTRMAIAGKGAEISLIVDIEDPMKEIYLCRSNTYLIELKAHF